MSTPPSKGATIFLSLFGLPFLGGGLFFLFLLFFSRGNFKPLETVMGITISLFFVAVGGGLMYGAIAGYGKLKRQEEIEIANPASPWLWRADWKARRAESQNKKSEIGRWVLAIFCGMIIFPVAAMLGPQLWGTGDPRIILVIGFSLAGTILITAAVRATIRRRWYGDTYFEFDALPFSPGERVRGRIHLRFETRADHGVDLELRCVRKIVTGAGDSRSTRRVVLWQEDKNVPSAANAPGPLGRAIPVEFELPSDALSTDQGNANDQIVWELHAKADVPGVNYTDNFEIPVFRTAEPTRASSAANCDSTASDAFGFPGQAVSNRSREAVTRPADAKVIVSMESGRTEFYFPAFRTPGRALLLFAVSLFWSGMVYLLYVKHVPWFFFVAFGFADVLILGGFLHVTFGSARIGVGNGEIVFRRGIFELGAAKRVPVSSVASIVLTTSMQQGGNTISEPYVIRLRTKDGRNFALADEIASWLEARWVVEQLESLAGLKVDTHVEVDLPLGVTACPPQPVAGNQIFRSQPRKSSAGSIAIFIMIVFAMFGWQAWRMFSFGTRATDARAAAAGRTKTIAPRVFSSPMTAADVDRVMALPIQQQAEELLERAIGHDERALHMFNKLVPEWIGYLQMTDRMQQLERRSEFSKDLRVRQANVGLNLALEGWHKDEEAVDALMERARNDQQYRAWAVYYLGMLAGCGVGYERIHDVILGYARNDPDPSVRQWAVEGMRFLGTDETLDELFVSFTEDPATAVRNRAGCNISDCGIFTRKQRMRTVPKLLELVRNPQTSAQMRSWSFLALQEITDESLPADAMAWSRWYVEHGEEKMAEFERLDWWQVRGDE
jgi:HEAT repeats